MSRLVVVSNRVAPVGEGQTTVGGLAVAVLAALEETGGLWFGWSGEQSARRRREAEVVVRGRLSFATVALTDRDVREYYNGFSNGALWPLLHYRLDLAQFRRRDWLGYMRVNNRLARTLLPLLDGGDTVWIHDYHLIPLARALRSSGARNRMGFFLHTPFPPADLFVALPWHRELLRALCDHDLVGFQTESDLASFFDCVRTAGGAVSDDGAARAFDRSVRTGVFPIGLDAANVSGLAEAHDRSSIRKVLADRLGGRRFILGVDRLDYSKGLPDRFNAYARMLDVHADLHKTVTLMQIAPLSRGDVRGYSDIRAELETLTGNVNGRFADFDWVPIHYLNRDFPRETLAGLYRMASVGLVTPLRDGMNLVAKEYVASQDADDPGVLVLSRFAGAAAAMKEALVVNPYDHDEVAAALYRALGMPRRERRRRWRALMDRLEAADVHDWRRTFLDRLADAPSPPAS